jgi:hypothetical protein
VTLVKAPPIIGEMLYSSIPVLRLTVVGVQHREIFEVRRH